ncbi:PLP-dependent aminotransferase family protein [Candidatus Epulonipiscium viviparus]|uniref:aminotransferase-like domain-containing protein n=1 Tax=Candidatus Epulonipiscium viviparus TaxID=420336 RepID=UPI00016C0038|nr:PLP-dependent aminotransferase family protein [Candidatus Epulopiscium viviparus]
MFCTIKISKSDPTPLYIQLADELAKLIDTGVLPSKTKLPTIRALASKLKINRDTVVNAYKLLESKNYVIAHIGSGTYVAPRPDVHMDFKKELVPASKTYFRRDLFKIDICKDIMIDILDNDGWDSFYDPLNREKQLVRIAITNFFKTVGVHANNTSVRLIKDTQNFILDLVKLLPNAAICVENFRDMSYTSTLSYLGFKVLEVPLQKDGLNLDILESYLKYPTTSYVFISSYNQNPTGISYSKENKLAIIALCEKYDAYIIEDGTFSDFLYKGNLESCYDLCKSDRVIYLFNFCKLYLPYLDYSFVALPLQLQKRLTDTIQITITERLIKYYLESNNFAALRCKLITECNLKFNNLYNLFQFSSTLKTSSTSGLFFWFSINNGNSENIISALLEQSIVVSPGSLFSSLPNNNLRLSVAPLFTSDIDIIIKALRQL